MREIIGTEMENVPTVRCGRLHMEAQVAKYFIDRMCRREIMLRDYMPRRVMRMWEAMQNSTIIPTVRKETQ